MDQNQQHLVDQELNPDQQVNMYMLAAALAQSLNNQPSQQPSSVPADDENTIDLVALSLHLLSKLHIILLAALIGALIMGIVAFFSVPLYTATAKLYVVGSQGTTLNISSLQLGNMLTMDYEEVFRTWEVHELVRQELNLDYDYEEMQSMLKVESPNDTRVLYINVEHTDPRLAADLANAYAKAAKQFILQTMDAEEPNVFSVALVPTTGAVMSTPIYTLIGFLAGAALMVVVLTLMFMLDDRPHTPEDIEKIAGIPTLTVLPKANFKDRSMGKKHRRGGI